MDGDAVAEPAGFVLPGFAVEALVGFGASGEVWRARDLRTGERVALKRVRPGAGAERLRREALVLASLRHPHLLRLRRVVPDGGEPVPAPVLVLDYVPGGSLATLLRARGTMAPGEVVTVATPVAQALASVHARGVVHGDVSPANVLLDEGGRPLLADLGVARLMGEGEGTPAGTPGFVDPALRRPGAVPDAAGDVRALAAVCVAALTGRPPADDDVGPRPGLPDAAPAPLAALLAEALAAEPLDRPSAAEFARRLWDACPPQALGLVPVPVEPEPEPETITAALRRAAREDTAPAAGAGLRASGRHGRVGTGGGRRRAVAATAVLALGAAGVVTAGVLGGGRPGGDDRAGARGDPASGVAAQRRPAGEPGPADSAEPGAADPSLSTPAAIRDWRVLLEHLDARRAGAFARGEPGALDAVYAAGSAALARDGSRLRELRAARLRARDLRLVVRAVVPDRVRAGQARLRVVDELRPYALVDRRGRVVRRVPGRGPVTWTVDLVRQPAGWRIAEVATA